MKDLCGHFGFQTLPFTREISTRDGFTSPDFESATKGLLRVVENRMSGALIAASGGGKTFCLRGLKNSLPEARFRVHYIKVTGLSKRDMCREICRALGCDPAGSYPGLVRRVQEYLSHVLEVEGSRPVLFVDEAHDLRPEVLAMFRILTNFEMDSKLVMSVIFSGQPPLKKLLQRSDLECVSRRLAFLSNLGALSRKEAFAYLKHRCLVAGGRELPFEAHAAEAVFEIARGNLRATDRLALASLEVAFEDGSTGVDANHVAVARSRLWA